MIDVLPSHTVKMASCTIDSVAESKLEVASSKIIICEFFSKALAIPTLCFSPPDSLSPLSPTIVSYPFSHLIIKSCSIAFSEASSTRCFFSFSVKSFLFQSEYH